MKKKLILISILSLIIFILSFLLDNIVSNNISNIWNPFLTNLMIFISYIFDPYTIILISIIISAVLFYKKKKSQALFLFLSTVIGGILIIIIKEIVQRARPLNQLLIESGYSFPSGHVVMATIFFLSLIYLLKNNLKYLLIFFIILVGFNRIYLNVHWFSDVIAGFILGVLILILVKYIIKK